MCVFFAGGAAVGGLRRGVRAGRGRVEALPGWGGGGWGDAVGEGEVVAAAAGEAKGEAGE